MSSVAAGVVDEKRGVLDSLFDDKATVGAPKPPDDVRKARALGANGGSEWRCQLASLRQATRLARECPDPQQIGRESLDVEEWRRETGAATERRHGGKVVVAAKQRRREVSCFLARAADPAGEGNMSDAEAWRRRTS
jgi:hypothetical protein